MSMIHYNASIQIQREERKLKRKIGQRTIEEYKKATKKKKISEIDKQYFFCLGKDWRRKDLKYTQFCETSVPSQMVLFTVFKESCNMKYMLGNYFTTFKEAYDSIFSDIGKDKKDLIDVQVNYLLDNNNNLGYPLAITTVQAIYNKHIIEDIFYCNPSIYVIYSNFLTIKPDSVFLKPSCKGENKEWEYKPYEF